MEKKDQTPIVILHGWNLSSSYYEDLKKLLEGKGYAVFVPTLPGFGKDQTLSHSLALSDYVSFVVDFFGQNQLKRAVVIGHSFGGRIALKLAAEYPSLIESLVLTGVPGVRAERGIRRFFFFALAKVGKYTSSFLPKFIQSTLRKFLYKIARRNDYPKTSGFLRKTFQSIIAEDLSRYFSRISCPVTLVWGKNDGIVPVRVAEKMKELLSRATLVVVDGETHALPYRTPEVFIREARL
ncbi:MAG TPA: alpha/beta hydrolase [Patescibacteria group bacterium]|nr:alpha/beta hydrolase [Patescibacteria group bacterium]